MHIVYVTNFFPPTHTGGTETYTYNLARTMREQGHTVRVVCAGTFDQGESHYPTATHEDVDGIEVYRLHFNWMRAQDIFMELADNVHVGAWFGGFLLENAPDIVHVTSCDTMSPRVIAVAKTLGIPVIVTLTDYWFLCMRRTLLHDDGSRCGGPKSTWGCIHCLSEGSKAYKIPKILLGESAAKRGLLWASTKPALTRQRGLRGVLGDVEQRQRTVKSLLLQADRIISPSMFLQAMYVKNGYPPDRIAVSAHGHDFSWLPKDMIKTPSHGVRFGYLGAIEPLKGVDILIHAFRSVSDPTARLTIHGDATRNPAYAAELRAAAEGDSRIHFAGRYALAERAEIFNGLDVIVVPSRNYENAPLVIAEAFAMNTPVIAADLGGMAEAVRHNRDGALFSPDSAESLADTLQSVIADPMCLDRWRSNIRPQRTIADEAAVLLRWYQELTHCVSMPKERSSLRCEEGATCGV